MSGQEPPKFRLEDFTDITTDALIVISEYALASLAPSHS